MNQQTMQQRGSAAREAAIKLGAMPADTRKQALIAVADALEAAKQDIYSANAKDLARAEEEGLAAPLLKRLKFDDEKLRDVTEGARGLAAMTDPVGNTVWCRALDDGLDLYKITTPLGVLGIIFESRPDAFVQISCLALKTGNAVMLKGGREALETNRALYKVIQETAQKAGLPDGWIQNLESREEVTEMLALDKYIDLIIPRGSNAFVRYIMDNSKIPVMGHADGICHTYVDKDCDIEKALRITVDSKTQYPAVCNATETLLVHKDVAQAFLPRFKAMLDDKHTVLKGDEAVRSVVDVQPATEQDWKTEYLDYILSAKVVDSVDEAINHINKYGSGHTDGIVTENTATARHFTSLVDSACVFTNCSTRFSDGFRFGFGAEVGVSTSKLHARGPVGIDGLMTYKYVLQGHGDIVADYAEGRKHFLHKDNDKKY